MIEIDKQIIVEHYDPNVPEFELEWLGYNIWFGHKILGYEPSDWSCEIVETDTEYRIKLLQKTDNPSTEVAVSNKEKEGEIAMTEDLKKLIKDLRAINEDMCDDCAKMVAEVIMDAYEKMLEATEQKNTSVNRKQD